MGTDIHSVFQAKTENGWIDIPSDYDEDRDYLLFAWLGNVRNGYGFAGIETHTPITPLSDCRGLPKDFLVDSNYDHPISSVDILSPSSREYYKEGDEMWMGDHSFSWLSGEEILNAHPPVVYRTGIVTKELYETWDHISTPEWWCGGISGNDIVVKTPEEIDDNTTHVTVEWAEDACERFSYFLDEVKKLTNKHGEIRFVFGFDS